MCIFLDVSTGLSVAIVIRAWFSVCFVINCTLCVSFCSSLVCVSVTWLCLSIAECYPMVRIISPDADKAKLIGSIPVKSLISKRRRADTRCEAGKGGGDRSCHRRGQT